MHHFQLLREKELSEFQLLTEKEVSSLLKSALQSLRNDRSKGRGLPYYKLGKSVRYSLVDVEQYLSTRKIFPENSGTDRGRHG